MHRAKSKKQDIDFSKLLVVVGALFFGYLFFSESPQKAESMSESFLILTVFLTISVIVGVHVYRLMRSLFHDLKSLLKQKRS